MKYSELLDRLQNLINYKPKQRELAEILNVKVSIIGNRAVRDSKFSLDEIFLIEQAYGIKGGLTGSLVPVNDNSIDIDYYSDVWASCGTGSMVFEETAEKLSVPKSLIQNYSQNKKYSVINSRGDSMTPFIQDRDKLIVEHWQGGQIIDNCIYVFRYANELFVKRLVKNITQIVIKSDNTLYEPIKISDKDQDFEVIGQIVGLMRDLR
jgi:phage repressor protein C with HTH and peptisase S24 domain